MNEVDGGDVDLTFEVNPFFCTAKDVYVPRILYSSECLTHDVIYFDDVLLFGNFGPFVVNALKIPSSLATFIDRCVNKTRHPLQRYDAYALAFNHKNRRVRSRMSKIRF